MIFIKTGSTTETTNYKINLKPEPNIKEAETLVNCTQVNAFFNHLMGELLTIVEASTTDAVQRKALKSVVGNKIHAESVLLQQWIIRASEGDGSPFPYLY